MSRLRLLAVLAAGALSLTVGLPAVADASVAPGAPGATATWTPADKHGFGTATSLTSKVWFSLEHGELTDVFYPDLGTPSLRDLQLIVTDGQTFADLERDATTSQVRLLDPPEPHLRAGQHRHQQPLPDHQDLRGRPNPVDPTGRPHGRVADRHAVPDLRICRPLPYQ